MIADELKVDRRMRSIVRQEATEMRSRADMASTKCESLLPVWRRLVEMTGRFNLECLQDHGSDDHDP